MLPLPTSAAAFKRGFEKAAAERAAAEKAAAEKAAAAKAAQLRSHFLKDYNDRVLSFITLNSAPTKLLRRQQTAYPTSGADKATMGRTALDGARQFG